MCEAMIPYNQKERNSKPPQRSKGETTMKNNNFVIAALVSLIATAAVCFAWCASGINSVGAVTLLLGAAFAACTFFTVLPRFNEQ